MSFVSAFSQPFAVFLPFDQEEVKLWWFVRFFMFIRLYTTTFELPTLNRMSEQQQHCSYRLAFTHVCSPAVTPDCKWFCNYLDPSAGRVHGEVSCPWPRRVGAVLTARGRPRQKQAGGVNAVADVWIIACHLFDNTNTSRPVTVTMLTCWRLAGKMFQSLYFSAVTFAN